MSLSFDTGGTGSDTGGTTSGGTTSGGTNGLGGDLDWSPPGPASDWAGMNLSYDVMWTDVTRMMLPFDTVKKDSRGYPLENVTAVSATDLGTLPTGDYNVSYKGNGALAVEGIATLTTPWVTVGDEHRAVAHVTSAPNGGGIKLTVTNGPGETVHDIHFYVPGIDYDASRVIVPEFLNLLAPFRTLRFMVFMATNGSQVVEWSDRTSYERFGKSAAGEPYEILFLLANLTGKDIWINIPAHASNDYVTKLADLLRDNLNYEHIAALRAKQGLTAPFQIDLELSNEYWGPGQDAKPGFLADGFNYFRDQAKRDPSRYPASGYTSPYKSSSWMGGGDFLLAAEYGADRLVQVSKIFRSEFSAIGKASIIKPVVSGWALGATFTDASLDFIRKTYGPVKDYVSYITLAPYWGVSEQSSLDNYFKALPAAITAYAATFQDFKDVATRYEVQVSAYEGGIGAGPAKQEDWPTFWSDPVQQAAVKFYHLATLDSRMYDSYVQYFTQWKKIFGHALYNQYALGSGRFTEFGRQWGNWTSILSVYTDPAACRRKMRPLTGNENLSDVDDACPEYSAFVDVGLKD